MSKLTPEESRRHKEAIAAFYGTDGTPTFEQLVKNMVLRDAEQQKKIGALESKLAIAVKALEFYSDKESWHFNLRANGISRFRLITPNDLSSLKGDRYGGKTARAALRELGVGKEEE